MLLAQLLGCFPVASQVPGENAFVTVPRVAAPPTLDGRIDRREWSAACAMSGLVAQGAQALAAPNTVVYLCHDAAGLYVAFRCLETEGSYPRAFAREHDDGAFEDDCVQVFVAPEDPRAARTAAMAFGGYDGALDTWYRDLQTVYEFTVNAAGARTEARNDVRDWDAPWAAAVGREEGAWTAELSLPFAALGLDRAPEDAVWGLNLFRYRPPNLSGWVCPAFGGYRPLPLGAVRLSSGLPIVRLAEPPAAGPGEHELRLEVVSPGAGPDEVTVRLVPPEGDAAERRIVLAAGATQPVSAPYRGAIRYDVRRAGEDVPLLAGEVPRPGVGGLELALRYFALPGEVRADVRVGETQDATEAVLTLQPEAGVARSDLRGRSGGTLTLPVKGRPGDRLAARLRVVAADGRVVAERSLDLTVPEAPAWRGTRAGLPLGVLPPWTAIRTRGHAVEMLGKRLRYEDLALPASIQCAGADLLAEPMRLAVRVDGQPVQWRSRRLDIREQADDHVLLGSTWHSAGLTLSVTSRVEYDGFMWNEVTLTPTGEVNLSRLALEVPFRQAACQYAYEGHAQAAHALSPLGLRRPIGENLWLGDEERGLAWFTESLEWVQARDRARQVEVLPQETQTLWRSTFIDTDMPLTQPYTARFALHVTPAKPVSLRKSRIYHGAFYGMETAPGGLGLTLSAPAPLDPAEGAFECWVKPAFDPGEAYDPSVDRSQYNRQFLSVRTSADETLILYYNADDRNFRCVTHRPDGSYPIVLSAPGQLPAGAWSYVGLAWGDQLRLNANGQAQELPVQGTVAGDVDPTGLRLDLGCFQVDELRLSSRSRPLEGVPEAPFTEDEATLLLDHCDTLGPGLGEGGMLVPGRFGQAVGTREETFIERLGREGWRIVIFHENWSRFQGYPDLAQVPKLKAIADACHANGMLFLIYFNQSVSTAEPEWEGFHDDLLAFPVSNHYHRDDVPQDCYTGCVNGPYGEMLLAGIERLADEAGIDGVYMDGTTVPWYCENPTHPGCGTPLGDGRTLGHSPLRATREFMKRLRSIFAQRRQALFLDAHTGGCLNIATQAFTDGYYDGETLHRYKPGFRLAPDVFVTGYMGQQFGVRGEFLPNRHTTDQALAISLVHDTATRGQPFQVDRALAPYEGSDTRFIGYWESSALYSVEPPQVLASLYLRPHRALLVLGSQTEAGVNVRARLAPLLARLPAGTVVRDAMSGETLPVEEGSVRVPLTGRGWRLVECTAPGP